MREILRFLGLAGGVLLLFGLVPYAVTGTFDLWAAIHITGGGILLASGILLNLAGFRRTVASRGLRERLRALTGAVLFCGILVVVNVLAARHPWRYDATEGDIHTLSDKTRAVVDGLEEPLEILAFFGSADPRRDAVAGLLERYAALGGRVSWRFVDPVRERETAIRLDVGSEGVIVARQGERSIPAGPDATYGATEGMITNLLLKVTRPGPRVVYVLTGHGEPAFDDLSSPEGLGAFSRSLGDDNFEVRPILLSAAPEVPTDAAVLLVAGPRKPLVEHEVEQIEAFLDRGGRLLAMLDPRTRPGLGELLAGYAVTLGDDMIVDQEQIPLMGPRLGLAPIVEDFPDHPVTRSFRERIVLFQARSVGVARDRERFDLEATVVARTRESSWAERGYEKMLQTGRVSGTGTRDPGPVPVAVAVRLSRSPSGADPPEQGSETRLLVIGDSDLARNANLDAYFNREFLLNTIQWLVGSEDLVAEGPRSLRPSRLDMTQADYRNLFRFSVLLLPEAVLILGLAVWWRRRTL